MARIRIAPPGRRLRRSSAATALVLGTVTFLSASEDALSRDYDVYSCRTPSGEAASVSDGPYGFQGFLFGQSTGSKHLDSSCAEDLEFGGLVAKEGHHQLDSGVAHRFHAPPDTDIRHFEVWLTGTLRQHGHGLGEVGLWHAQQSDPEYTARWFGSPRSGGFGNPAAPLGNPNRVAASGLSAGHYTIRAQCWGGPGAHCPSDEGPDVAQYRVFMARTTLNDDVRPGNGTVTGDLVRRQTLSGVATATINASDRGSGVYRALLDVDGTTRQTYVLDDFGGRCRPLDDAATRRFKHPRPCRDQVTGEIAFDTRGVPDGERTVRIRVEDAAGNTATLLEDRRVVDNVPPPRNIQAPEIFGRAQAGTTLVAEDGEWSGEGVTLALRWQRCVAGTDTCTDIATATDRTYDARSADAGWALRVSVTATNREGSTTARSAQTDRVRRADGSLPQCADGTDNDGDGRLDAADRECDDPGDDREAAEQVTGSAGPSGPVGPTGQPGADGSGGNGGTGTNGANGQPTPQSVGQPTPQQDIRGQQGASGTGNGSGADRPAALRVRFVRSRSTRLTVGYGVQPVVEGSLHDGHGRAISDATIETVHELPAGLGRVTRPGARTDELGNFRLVLPRGTSRRVQFRWTGADGAQTRASVRLEVRALSSIAAAPKRLRNGHRVRFRGQIAGIVPDTGATVLLQVRVRGQWRTFKSVRSDARGRWRSGYRFLRTTTTKTYRFRARVARDSGLPYAPGHSRSVRVVVAG